MANGDLTSPSDQNVEAERADDGDHYQIEDRQVIFAKRERHDSHECDRQRSHGPLGDWQREDRHVSEIAGFENPRFAVDHGASPAQMRSISLRPKMPYGLIISAPIIST